MAITITQSSPANIQTGTGNVIAITVDSANRIVGAGSAVQLVASGGTGPYTWQIMAGALPPGCTLDPSGSIRSTPQARGTALVLFRATDSSNPANFVDAWLQVTVQ